MSTAMKEIVKRLDELSIEELYELITIKNEKIERYKQKFRDDFSKAIEEFLNHYGDISIYYDGERIGKLSQLYFTSIFCETVLEISKRER